MELNRPKEIYNGVKGIPSYNMLWRYIDELEIFADDCELYIHNLETKYQAILTENKKLRESIKCKDETEKRNFREITDLLNAKNKLIEALIHIQNMTDYCHFNFEQWNDWSMGYDIIKKVSDKR